MILIDPLRWVRVKKRRGANRQRWAHMVSSEDGIEELTTFADAIGMKRAWLQEGRHTHYDLRPGKWRQALEAGALIVSTRDVVRRRAVPICGRFPVCEKGSEITITLDPGLSPLYYCSDSCWTLHWHDHGDDEGALSVGTVVDALFERESQLLRGMRERLPNRRERDRQSNIQVKIGGQSVYLRVGEYADGRPGEVFITVAKMGDTEHSQMDAFAIVLSIALQHGVPLEAFVHRLVGTNSQPNGVVVGHDRIKMTSSLHDFTMRHLAIDYLGRDDLANV